jgi:hypothetical protein
MRLYKELQNDIPRSEGEAVSIFNNRTADTQQTDDNWIVCVSCIHWSAESFRLELQLLLTYQIFHMSKSLKQEDEISI